VARGQVKLRIDESSGEREVGDREREIGERR
jgi:hypothetical protein